MINKKLKINLSIIDLYENKTIIMLAKYIKANKKSDLSYMEEAHKCLENIKMAIKESDKLGILDAEIVEDYYPISDIQMGMILQSMKSKENSIYHDQHILKFFDEEFNLDNLQKSLNLLVENN